MVSNAQAFLDLARACREGIRERFGKATAKPFWSSTRTTCARCSRLIWCRMPLPGGTTRKRLKDSWAQRIRPKRSRFNVNSTARLRAIASGDPEYSATAE